MNTSKMNWLGAALLSIVTGCASAGSDEYAQPGPPGQGDLAGGSRADFPGSAESDRILDVPFYFGMPKAAITTPLNRPAYPYPTVWNRSTEVEEVGLRMIAVKQASNSTSSKRAARREMARELAAAGVLQDGDIVLSFRPELAGTMAYPHVQMGSTHAGLVYTRDGEAFNIDSPLDSDYVGQFDSSHYAGNGTTDLGTDTLHIVRPTAMDDERRENLRFWVGALLDNRPVINDEGAQLKFQSDYLLPIYASLGVTTQQTVTKLGQIILQIDETTKLPMYCSEFAWHMLALSNCTEDEIMNAPEEGASCVSPAFDTMPFVGSTEGEVGMADGPLYALMQAPEDQRAALAASVFVMGDSAKLSSGHRAVAEQLAPMMDGVSQYYQARAAGVPFEALTEATGQLNGVLEGRYNYSPTAFFVHAMDTNAETRKMDYVVTLAFVLSDTYDKARVLSRMPVP
jgi:hypothetical protein